MAWKSCLAYKARHVPTLRGEQYIVGKMGCGGTADKARPQDSNPRVITTEACKNYDGACRSQRELLPVSENISGTAPH
ncbi:hypothetical protein [Noviherbaspirillum sp.]|uniref:hypothetical protein n=1 Tax=Noviherbaspirillum sp. TaxID=1926288 RepID=UPI002FE0ACE7